ncbi:hypothetical protein E2493_13715 [Sphingomonas parva]|uniref:Tryptophan-rich sensory protein n=1 Tax=Sphingomonas parva TaxID=2555898 RepID=A0A4Y8ZNX2_9SPHN|nr:hypothetical protein [Sphingomonas parva]TFI57701.1 hypothetical protein E2493_13715 [Sphingomonas parva]
MSSPASPPVATRSSGQRLAIAALAVVQILVTLLPSAGIGAPIGERSDNVRTLITPAGWAFSIWGPLYAGSLAYAVYQLLPGQRDNGLLARIGWASAGAFLGNAAWALYVQFVAVDAVSAAIIAFTLACLLSIYRALAEARAFSRGERFLVALPLSALAAWLTAATIVNIAAALVHHGVDAGESAPLVAAAIVLVGGAIAAAAIWRGRGNPWYALVFLWALAGIHAAEAGRREVDAATLAAGVLVLAVTLARLAGPANRRHWLGGPA